MKSFWIQVKVVYQLKAITFCVSRGSGLHMRANLSRINPLKWNTTQHVIASLLIFGPSIIVFDILRKSILLQASWNYHFPQRRLTYDPILTGIFIALSIAVVWGVPRILSTTRKKFIIVTYVLALIIATLSLYTVPMLAADATAAPNDEFSAAATVVIEQGPIEFFSQFHKIGVPSGRPPHIEEAQMVADWLRMVSFIPGADKMASYASEMKVQKHGPVPLLLLAPFIYLLDQGVETALLGEYVLFATLPIIAYHAYRLHFEEKVSRIGTYLVLSAPSLMIYQRGPNPYDVVTAIFIGISLFAFLRGLQGHMSRRMATSGITFSLASLSKITALPMLAGYALLIYLVRDTRRGKIKSFAEFLTALLTVPILLLLVGYNFFIQYLFTISRLLNQSEISSSDPAANLADPLIKILAPIYNIRLFGFGLLLFVFVYIVIRSWNRETLTVGRDLIAVSLLVPLLPFIPVMIGLTAARHLLPYIIPIGFVGLAGLEQLESEPKQKIRIIQAVLAVNFGILIVGL